LALLFCHVCEGAPYWFAAPIIVVFVTGPAVVEEYGATVPVHPGYRARVDAHANLRLTRTTA